MDYTLFRKTISSFYPLKENELDTLQQKFNFFEAGRKQILLEAGETEQYLYFVLSGIQRVYYWDENHKEATIVFMYSPSFGGVLDSFLLQIPSRYFLETLTPSTFLRIHSNDLHLLQQTCPAIQQFVHLGLIHAFKGVLERLVELQVYSSEDKFKALLQRSPHILNLVPHKYLANYLGIDPTNFSKLLNSVAI